MAYSSSQPLNAPINDVPRKLRRLTFDLYRTYFQTVFYLTKVLDRLRSTGVFWLPRLTPQWDRRAGLHLKIMAHPQFANKLGKRILIAIVESVN